jgi:hypothetical protein
MSFANKKLAQIIFCPQELIHELVAKNQLILPWHVKWNQI